LKIAIVAPSPVPFTVGGAEKLWWGLQNHINQSTHHQCELIKVPTSENSFWKLINSYYQFHKLDLSSFDMVISGKYPAWMVQHPNHHIYMLHCLRGLYDTYPFLNKAEQLNTDHPKTNKVLSLIDKNSPDLETFFNLVLNLNNDKNINNNLFDFPGPFIRKIVHFLDRKAMENIKSFSAISRTVTKRKEYFPANSSVKVIYPPSNLKQFTSNSYDYFFTASRLDNAKRVKTIIEAYLKSNTPIPLKIAGIGPMEEELRHLAVNDSRIEFLGFVSDNDLESYYANAYAVIFIPYEEDYGLITIEAMMCEKSVITFTDAGGVTEFVEEGKTGFISEPSVENLKNCIERAAADKDLIVKMGKYGRTKVNNITWKNTVNSLLKSAPSPVIVSKARKKITVATTYPIYPPRGGGQNRVYYLYRELAKTFDIEIISLANENETGFSKEIAPNLIETRVPKSKKHAHKEWNYFEKEVGIPVTDIAMLFLYNETNDYINAIISASKNSAFIISSHPYTFGLIKKHTDLPVIHESHNMEYLLKKEMLPDNKTSKKLLNRLFEAEKDACLNSILTTVCSADDAAKLAELYGADISRIIEVPNGTDSSSMPFISSERRIENKKKLDFQNIRTALFIGSYHKPNLDAIEKIISIATSLPDIRFLIIGSAGSYFAASKHPENMGFMGIVDDKEMNILLSTVDVALNPMMSGSGTNLKMLDYMAAGIPVISTKVGARGLNIPKGYIVECEIEEFGHHIRNVEKHVDVSKSRAFVEDRFSWKVIGQNFIKSLSNL